MESFYWHPPPVLSPGVAKGFEFLKENTPKDSLIWTWWDYGYPIEEMAERATYHDGGSMRTPKTYFIARSFFASKSKTLHNIITGITHLGLKGLKELLKDNDPPTLALDLEQGRYSAEPKHPIYLIFTGDEVIKSANIHYIGSWNFEKGTGTKEGFLGLGRCRWHEGGSILRCEKGSLDMISKKAFFKGKWLTINTIATSVSGNEDVRFSFLYRSHNKGVLVILRTHEGKMWGYISGPDLFYSAFAQMYLLGRYNIKHFTLVKNDFPEFVAYRLIK